MAFGGSHRDGDHGAHGPTIHLFPTRGQERSQAAGDRREDDVVDRASECVLHFLDLGDVSPRQAQRRSGPIGPSRTDSGRITFSPARARPYSSVMLWRVKRSGALTARTSPCLTSSRGTRNMSSSADVASLAGEGSALGVHGA